MGRETKCVRVERCVCHHRNRIWEVVSRRCAYAMPRERAACRCRRAVRGQSAKAGFGALRRWSVVVGRSSRRCVPGQPACREKRAETRRGGARRFLSKPQQSMGAEPSFFSNTPPVQYKLQDKCAARQSLSGAGVVRRGKGSSSRSPKQRAA